MAIKTTSISNNPSEGTAAAGGCGGSGSGVSGEGGGAGGGSGGGGGGGDSATGGADGDATVELFDAYKSKTSVPQGPAVIVSCGSAALTTS